MMYIGANLRITMSNYVNLARFCLLILGLTEQQSVSKLPDCLSQYILHQEHYHAELQQNLYS